MKVGGLSPAEPGQSAAWIACRRVCAVGAAFEMKTESKDRTIISALILRSNLQRDLDLAAADFNLGRKVIDRPAVIVTRAVLVFAVEGPRNPRAGWIDRRHDHPAGRLQGPGPAAQRKHVA